MQFAIGDKGFGECCYKNVTVVFKIPYLLFLYLGIDFLFLVCIFVIKNSIPHLSSCIFFPDEIVLLSSHVSSI